MNAKLLIYFFSSAIVIYSIDAININFIFKKNKVFQATMFTLVLALIMIYILTQFIYDFFTISSLI